MNQSLEEFLVELKPKREKAVKTVLGFVFGLAFNFSATWVLVVIYGILEDPEKWSTVISIIGIVLAVSIVVLILVMCTYISNHPECHNKIGEFLSEVRKCAVRYQNCLEEVSNPPDDEHSKYYTIKTKRILGDSFEVPKYLQRNYKDIDLRFTNSIVFETLLDKTSLVTLTSFEIG